MSLGLSIQLISSFESKGLIFGFLVITVLIASPILLFIGIGKLLHDKIWPS